MAELARAVGALLERLADFFDLFDLSFFVSGGTFVLAVAVWLHHRGVAASSFGDWALVAGVLLAYVAGLGCFAVGRAVRRTLLGPWAGLDSPLAPDPADASPRDGGRPFLGFALAANLRALGLDADPRFAPLFAPDEAGPLEWRDGLPARWSRTFERRFAKLYARLWGELRETASDGAGYRLLRSYWVRAATLDGLVVAVGAWGVLASQLVPHMCRADHPAWCSPWMVWIATVVLLGFLMHEAARFDRYQLEELVGLHAARRDRARDALTRLWGLRRTEIVDAVVEAAVGARMPGLVEDVVARLGGAGTADPDALRAAAAEALHAAARRAAEAALAGVVDEVDPAEAVPRAVESLRRAWSDPVTVVEIAAADPRLAALGLGAEE